MFQPALAFASRYGRIMLELSRASQAFGCGNDNDRVCTTGPFLPTKLLDDLLCKGGGWWVHKALL